MKKFDNLQAAIHNLKDIYSYQAPYGNVEMTGMVGLYEICFEQAWKAMRDFNISRLRRGSDRFSAYSTENGI